MHSAGDGYNRDVVFGVLLGRQYDVQLANQIADSVWALHESRLFQSVNGANVGEPPAQPEHPENSPGEASEPGRRHASVFDALWDNFFGVRS